MKNAFPRLLTTFAVAATAAFLTGCNSDHARFPSPDGKNVVWVFTRDGGATTSYSRQVSIGRGKPAWIGNIYVQNEDEDVGVGWLSNTELELTIDARANSVTKKTSYGEIKISYRAR
jgi:hypothetical protein